MFLDTYATPRERANYSAETLLSFLKHHLMWSLMVSFIAGVLFITLCFGQVHLKTMSPPKLVIYLGLLATCATCIGLCLGACCADISDYHADLFRRARATPDLIWENKLLRERLAQRRSDLVTLDYGGASYLDSIPDLSLSPTTPVDGLHLSPNS